MIGISSNSKRAGSPPGRESQSRGMTEQDRDGAIGSAQPPLRTPRLRPGLLLFLLLVAGLGLLYTGAKRGWSIGLLAATDASMPVSVFAWYVLGAAYGSFATLLWAQLTSGPAKLKLSMAFTLMLCPMFVGSVFAATLARERMVLIVTGVRLDPESGHILVDYSGPPGVVRACERGTLRPWVRGWGYHDNTLFKFGEGPGEPSYRSRDLQGGRYVRDGLLPVHYSELTGSGTIRIPMGVEMKRGSWASVNQIEAGFWGSDGRTMGKVSHARIAMWLVSPVQKSN